MLIGMWGVKARPRRYQLVTSAPLAIGLKVMCVSSTLEENFSAF